VNNHPEKNPCQLSKIKKLKLKKPFKKSSLCKRIVLTPWE